MGSTVDGLVSGLSTSSLIQQLMQAESAGQQALQAKVTARNQETTAYQSINTKAAALKSATAGALAADSWRLAKATSSDSTTLSISAAAGAAATGQLTVAVTALAHNHVRTVEVAGTGAITSGSGIDLTIGGTLTHVAVTTDTAAGVAAAINGAGLDVRATVVNADGGATILQLSASKTGAASSFTIGGLQAGGGTVVTQGTDAQLTVGTVGLGGYSVSSSTNTFTNVLPNVTLTALKEGTTATINVQQDPDGTAAKIQSMVDAANSLLTENAKQSAFGTGGSSSAVLAGNTLVRQLSSKVLSAAGNGTVAYGSFAQLGVQLTKDGKLTFDKAKFATAFQANPSAVQTAVTGTDGLATALDAVAAGAKTDLDNTIQSQTSTVKSLTDQIANWDVRLKLRQDSLQRQFSAMEVALGKMKDQSNWLAGQIAKLG